MVNLVREENEQPIIYKQHFVTKEFMPVNLSFQGGKAILVGKATNTAEVVAMNYFTSQPIQLRLVWQDGEIIGQMKPASEPSWTTVAQCPAFKQTHLKVGLLTLVGRKENGSWVDFSKFSVRKTINLN